MKEGDSVDWLRNVDSLTFKDMPEISNFGIMVNVVYKSCECCGRGYGYDMLGPTNHGSFIIDRYGAERLKQAWQQELICRKTNNE